ncbi:TIM-barrel domain-containing protein [Cutibacterium sp.]|uniref:TIM-barrel domain-containing protein n=1 Tax=Cutibacterium sp. TaxID=1912221 RepID=UPI0026DAEBE2|nr:TIM-barrel domain-containing protein [Cutibacterium sp.]MDO4413290.1 glycoside hydrolase family 31 protein [Cutibacterium sp.]
MKSATDRSPGPGSHRYPIDFSGDSVISWETLDFQPEFTATASNIGYGWWSHDIGGHIFSSLDDQLMARWAQFGVLSPINRLHSTKNEFGSKEPWHFRAETETVMRQCLRMRHRLIPYLHSENLSGHRNLCPLIRPVYWTHPEWEESYVDRNEYWFGSQLLVRPVTTKRNTATGLATTRTWLPPLAEGLRWVDLLTGLTYTPQRFVTMARSIDEVPVLAKPGTIVPTATDPLTKEDIPTDLTLVVVPGAAGHFDLLEDGDELRRTPLDLDANGMLRIGPSEGSGPNVVRRWRVSVHSGGHPVTIDLGEHRQAPEPLRNALLEIVWAIPSERLN